jgi:hypothetical protein
LIHRKRGANIRRARIFRVRGVMIPQFLHSGAGFNFAPIFFQADIFAKNGKEFYMDLHGFASLFTVKIWRAKKNAR